MNQSLDAVITELEDFLEKGDADPVWDYLGKLELQLKELAGQRPTFEELKAAIGQGVHKGMRVNNAADAYLAVDRLDDKTWDGVLDYAAYCLKTMKMVDTKKES